MAKIEQETSVLKRVTVDMADTLADFLNPHLESRSPVENSAEDESWPLRKTFLFVVGISLVLWALIFAVLQMLFRL
jgi:hypothetical protein